MNLQKKYRDTIKVVDKAETSQGIVALIMHLPSKWAAAKWSVELWISETKVDETKCFNNIRVEKHARRIFEVLKSGKLSRIA